MTWNLAGHNPHYFIPDVLKSHERKIRKLKAHPQKNSIKIHNLENEFKQFLKINRTTREIYRPLFGDLSLMDRLDAPDIIYIGFQEIIDLKNIFKQKKQIEKKLYLKALKAIHHE